MIKVYDSERVPIKSWVTDLEEGALDQAKAFANLPFVYKWVSLMPDAHYGVGVPIGSVLATKGVVIPSAVGVDIGCGMASLFTSLYEEEVTTEQLKKVMGIVRKIVPVGFDHHKENQEWTGFDKAPSDLSVVLTELSSARKQLGTLGQGNHFIEVQKVTNPERYGEGRIKGKVNIMVHSGSRNFGLKIAKFYQDLAAGLCSMWYSNIPNKDLAFLPLDEKVAQDYLSAMNFALEFAKENRLRTLIKVSEAFQEVFPEVTFSGIHNVHHNYATMENHYGENVMVHRKGATSAREGELGLIPGSQGTKSYVVRGKGNPESFTSCSHGAGRKMGRKEAVRSLDLVAEKKILDDQGIVHSIRNKSDLEEAAGAYKDIQTVMENQKDLVDIEFELSPMAVIKG